MKKNKGITLVALVVTIVVLLILAGVSINLVLGDNGIIAKAKEAQRKSAEASENDLKGMNSLIEQMESTLNGGSSDNKEDDELGKLVNDMGTLPEDTTPYFPSSDFKRREKTNTENGLVIEDTEGNEYVWVVVPRTTAVYATTGLGKTTFTDADYTNIETDLKNYTSTYVTKEGYSDTHEGDTANVGWLTSDEYTELKNRMLKSVYENGGFYVGRYEAGIETTGTNRTRNTDKNSDGKYTMPSTVPVTKADAYPYTYVTRTQAQNLASKVNSGTKTSSLMFGVQWDLVLAFMSKDTAKITSTDVLTKNSTTIGNYYDSTFQLSQTGKYATYSNWTLSSTWNPSTTATTDFVDSSKNKLAQSDGNGILVTTGTSEKNKVMNIYDIAGNVWEWTLENTSSTDNPCARRGGRYVSTGSDSPASSRNDVITTDSGNTIGFRVSLW